MLRQPTITDIRQALDLSDFDVLSAHRLMMPVARNGRRPPQMAGRPRIGCVLLLLYCAREQVHLVLTRRRDDLNSHAGQISFPGGRQEPGESYWQTALRETEEEIGINPAGIEILGELAAIYIPPSDFEVHPFVGWYTAAHRPPFMPQENEVAELLEVPLPHLLDPTNRKVMQRQFQGHPVDIPYFDVYGHIVWGATAIMLAEFVERVRLQLPA